MDRPDQAQPQDPSPTQGGPRSYRDALLSGTPSQRGPHAPPRAPRSERDPLTTTTLIVDAPLQESDAPTTAAPTVAPPTVVAFNADAREAGPNQTEPALRPRTESTPRRRRWFLDSGANTHLIKPSDVDAHGSAPRVHVQGISGAMLATPGQHRTLGASLVGNSRSGRNLISLSRLTRTHDVQFDPRLRRFTASRGDTTMIYLRR